MSPTCSHFLFGARLGAAARAEGCAILMHSYDDETRGLVVNLCKAFDADRA
jgi:hypothetical protein